MKKKKKIAPKAKATSLTKHGKFLCMEFVKFVTVVTLATCVVLGGYSYTKDTQVLGASTSIYQVQCSFWNFFCRFQTFFKQQLTNQTTSVTPTPTQDETVTSSVDPKSLTLGDGKYTTSAKKGYIYTCQTSFNGSGAQTDGSWIHGTTWDSTAKISVLGSVSWPNAKFTVTTAGDKRVVSGNGLPVGYTTGVFPVASTDPAYAVDRNPNSIKVQTYSFSLPLNPQLGAQTTCIRGVVGIAVDGIPIFDGLDAEGRDAVAHEVQDSCDGHPQEAGQYHYHGPSSCLKEIKEKNTLVGYALDGYGIYSMYDASGKEYTNADLDECHGITSEVMWNGKMQSMYHYVMTREYPYSVGCFRGSSVLNEQQFTGSNSSGQGNTMKMQGMPGMQGTRMPYPPQGINQRQPQGGTGYPPPPRGTPRPY